MVELNETIKWVPEHIREGRFGNWLENNIDWALSRERFWGTPLPLWTDGKGDYICIGSVAELERVRGASSRDLDLHRPAIDGVTFKHEGREYRRVPEVIDCWFDSGAMPYAQWHYPFENREHVREELPGRLHLRGDRSDARLVLHAARDLRRWSSDSVAYKNVDVLEPHRRRRRQEDVEVAREHHQPVRRVRLGRRRRAALALHRSSRARRAEARLGRDHRGRREQLHQHVLEHVRVLRDVRAARRLRRRAQRAARERPEIDRWIISLLEQTIATATAALDDYDALTAGAAIERFVDQLSNWYVRRNRRRFWKAASGDDKQSAYLTLYECLES